MVRLFGTCSSHSCHINSATRRLRSRIEITPIRSLDSRRLGLMFVFAFCALSGARPVVAGFVQPPIVTPVLLSVPDN